MGFVDTTDFGLAIQGVLDRRPKFLPMELSLRVTFKKANAMYPPSRGQIKPGSCPCLVSLRGFNSNSKSVILFPPPPLLNPFLPAEMRYWSLL